jgi:lipoprotein-anchoring transpeptidase ErfK/SrfK
MSARKTLMAGMAALIAIFGLVAPAAAQSNSFRTIFSPSPHLVNPPSRTVRQAPLYASRGMAATQRVDNKFMRQTVAYQTKEKAGTVIVDTRDKFLYLVQGDGTALRYGIGVARPGFEWKGTHKVTAKREWPGWTPPAAMRKRQPHLPAYMEGGPNNPLGARALYLGSTLYRIHGTNEPMSIGQTVSSGCIRMVNDDVIDLYTRVSVGTRVIVI